MEFPYFTLRNRTGSPDPGGTYGSERSDLKAGFCEVTELDLGVLTPLADAAPPFMREDLLRVASVREATPDAVLESLERTAGGRSPSLYVHGYYIGFEKGCRRAALLQQNADLAGRFLWFSWPSNGSAAFYTRDEADLYWSLPDIAETIQNLEQRFAQGTVDIIGHSLGARGVMLALAEVANRSLDIRLGHVVLLAPDIDFGIFERILPSIAPIVDGITIYVTDADRPLLLSAQLHGQPRLGQAENDVSGLEGVEVIDLSDLPHGSPTGHLYHIYSRAVGQDLRLLLNEDKPASLRPGLVKTDHNAWKMATDT